MLLKSSHSARASETYEAVDEYNLDHCTPQHVWERLHKGAIRVCDIPHNCLQVMNKMGLTRTDRDGWVHLTAQGATYASLIVASPF